MRAIVFTIVTLLSLKATAQTHLLGVKAGPSWTNVTSDIFGKATRYRSGISAGLTYEYETQKPYTFGAEVMYNQRGFRLPSLSSAYPDGGLVDKFNSDYLFISAKAGIRFGRKLVNFINVGVGPSLLMNANTIVSVFDANAAPIGYKTTDVTNNVKRFDLAGFAEVGTTYRFGSHYVVFASAAYQHSFSSITTTEYFAGNTIRHMGINASLGLKYALAANN